MNSFYVVVLRQDGSKAVKQACTILSSSQFNRNRIAPLADPSVVACD